MEENDAKHSDIGPVEPSGVPSQQGGVVGRGQGNHRRKPDDDPDCLFSGISDCGVLAMQCAVNRKNTANRD